MTTRRLEILTSCLGLFILLFSQDLYSKKFHFPGEKPSDPGLHAFVGGDIQVRPDKRIKNGMLLIRDGIIEKVGRSTEIPPFYREWNCSGKTIYPGLIDPYLLSGSKDPSLLSLGHQESILAQSNSSFLASPKPRNQKFFGFRDFRSLSRKQIG